MKTKMICLLDKEFPPEHSFVDGMLSTKKLRNMGISVLLLTSKGKAKKKVGRYGKASALPMLKNRQGIKRFYNFFLLYFTLEKLIKKYRLSNYQITLFVRNEPIYLLVAAIFRKKVDRLVFQQSFPHEINGTNYIKNTIAKSIFKLTRKQVDKLLTVSPLGLKRLRNYFGLSKPGTFIPLLNSSEINKVIVKSSIKKPVRFVYIGTHDKERKLENLFNAIESTKLESAEATFTFIGGNSKDIERLKQIDSVNKLVEQGSLIFKGKIPRKELLQELVVYDVGLCLIPPEPIYIESSPTKLVEYMGAGLAVIASKGIPLQEKFASKSNGSILTNWNSEEMSSAILYLANEEQILLKYKKNTYNYAVNFLTYERYFLELKRLIC